MCLVIKSDLLCFFDSAMCYGIIFWGKLLHSTITFRIEETVIRIMEGCRNRVSCRNLLKKLQILPLTSQNTLFLLMFVVQKKKFSQKTIKITI